MSSSLESPLDGIDELSIQRVHAMAQHAVQMAEIEVMSSAIAEARMESDVYTPHILDLMTVFSDLIGRLGRDRSGEKKSLRTWTHGVSLPRTISGAPNDQDVRFSLNLMKQHRREKIQPLLMMRIFHGTGDPGDFARPGADLSRTLITQNYQHRMLIHTTGSGDTGATVAALYDGVIKAQSILLDPIIERALE